MNKPPKLSLSLNEALEMPDFDLCDHLWSLVSDEYYKQERANTGSAEESDDEPALCNYPESLFAMQLPVHWWTAYAVHAFEYDVPAGGILQFLDNHEGLTNEQTAAAFRNIGRQDLADAFLIVGNAYLEFRKERCPKYSGLSEKESESVYLEIHKLLLDARKKGFDQIYDSANLHQSLAKYIRDNFNLYS